MTPEVDMSGFEAALGAAEEGEVNQAIDTFAKRLGHYRNALIDQGFESHEAFSLVEDYAKTLLAPRWLV